MPTAAHARLRYEAAQSLYANALMTDSGDRQKFTLPGTTYWSNRAGFIPQIRPNGVVSGGVVIPAVSALNDSVDISALTAYLAGILESVGADTDESITRPATNVAKINSVTVTAAGSIAVIAGTDGATSAFSETRGDAGGPPWIPTDSIEIAQIRVSSSTAAPITSAEIFSIEGTHRESQSYPQFEVKAIGDKNNNTAYIQFLAPVDAIHSDDAGANTHAKQIWGQVYEPVFGELSVAADFVPPETTHSVNSTQVYNTTIGSRASNLTQGSFTAYGENNVTDPLMALIDENLVFQFHPDRYASAHIVCQGVLGAQRSFPAGDNMSASCTISSEFPSVNRAA